MAPFTFSAAPRVERCPASAVLPPVPDETPREARDRGTVIHHFVVAAAVYGREKALEMVPEEFKGDCATINLDAMPHGDPESWAFEVGFAWDWEKDAGRELFRTNTSRRYDTGPTEIAGTADVIGLQEDAVVVPDLKTGWQPLGPPEQHLQLLALAIAAARAYGKPNAVVGFLRLTSDGEPVYQTTRVSALELDAAAARLRAVVDAVQAEELILSAGGEVSPVLGPHCKYCPAFLRCPAQMGLARELARTVATDGAELAELPPLEPETAPRVLERLEAGEMLLKRVRAHVETYATAHPVRLPDGRVFGLLEKTREGFDPELGRPVLAELGLEHAVEVEASLSKASLKRAIGKVQAPRGTEKRALDALRSAGAATVKTYTAVDYFTPKALPEGAEG